jgi:glucokinase
MLYDKVRKEFDRYNHIPKPVDFRFAELKQDFGIIGAAELAREL